MDIEYINRGAMRGMYRCEVPDRDVVLYRRTRKELTEEIQRILKRPRMAQQTLAPVSTKP